jgi:hypothetical protein
MVTNPLYPESASISVRAIGEDVGILHGNLDLIIKAVGNPALNLFL